MAISIGDDEFIVGRVDARPGRHGLLYQELSGAYADEGIKKTQGGKSSIQSK